ncbi:MAG: molybdenum cofactor guanylyltransferase MobA [Pseudomonas sp.]
MFELQEKHLGALLLAGGEGRRLGGRDKGLMPWNGRPIAVHLIEMLEGLVNEVIISCNRNHEQYAQWADRLVSDPQGDFPGPLAGILEGLRGCTGSHLLVLPCDLPGLDRELLTQLLAQAAQTPEQPCLVRAGEQWQPLLAVIPRALLANLQQAWDQGQRSPRRWLLNQAHSVLQLPAEDPRLHNANCPEDWR